MVVYWGVMAVTFCLIVGLTFCSVGLNKEQQFVGVEEQHFYPNKAFMIKRGSEASFRSKVAL